MANDKKEPNLNDVRMRNNKIIEEFFLKSTQLVEKRFDELNGYLNQLTTANRRSDRSSTMRVSMLNKYRRYKELIKSDVQKQGRKRLTKGRKRPLPDSTQTQSDEASSKKDLGNDFSIAEQIANLTVELKIKHERVSSTSKESNVILMWNLMYKSDHSILKEEDPLLDEIKEYQIFGFREVVGESPYKANNCISNCAKWTLVTRDDLIYQTNPCKLNDCIYLTKKQIGVVEPYCPPIKCTLTDFRQGSVYYFSIRIKYKNNKLSEFSQPSMIKL